MKTHLFCFCPMGLIILFLLLILMPPSGTISAKSEGKKITIIYTNDTCGVLEPCGCGGRNTGGLSRRATVIRNIQAENPNCLIVESGNLAYPVNPSQPTAQLDAVADSLKSIGYTAVGVGEIDTKFGDKYFEILAEKGISVVHAGQLKQDVASPYIIKVIDGIKVGIVSFGYVPPEKYTPDIRKAQCESFQEARKESNVLILLDQANVATDEWLGDNKAALGYPDIVVGGISRMPLTEPRWVEQTMIAPTSSQGTYVGRIDIEIDEDKMIMTFSRTLIDPRVPVDPDIRKIVKAYEKSQKVSFGGKSYELQPYYSYQTCVPCHTEEYKQWSETRHGKALATLLDAERAIPDCLPCHSDMYKRQNRIVETRDKVGGVECIACHIDVLPHKVNYVKKGDTSIIKAKCQECHAKERSPDFDLDSYYDLYPV